MKPVTILLALMAAFALGYWHREQTEAIVRPQVVEAGNRVGEERRVAVPVGEVRVAELEHESGVTSVVRSSCAALRLLRQQEPHSVRRLCLESLSVRRQHDPGLRTACPEMRRRSQPGGIIQSAGVHTAKRHW